MRHLTYSLSYLIFLGLPASVLLLYFQPHIDQLALLVTIFATFLIGGVFDILATRQGTKDRFFIWEYSSRSTLKRKLHGVPIEDFVLFLSLTPIVTICLYESARGLRLGQLPLVPSLLFSFLSLFLIYRLAHYFSKNR